MYVVGLMCVWWYGSASVCGGAGVYDVSGSAGVWC